jgi:hypothetical protein
VTTRRRGEVMRYVDVTIDPAADRLTCRYEVDGRPFVEVVTLPGGGDWSHPAAVEAARWVFLLAGVSYYKTAAPPVVDLGEHGLTDDERAFLRAYYYEGLGEFAHVNGLDLGDLELRGPTRQAPVLPPLQERAGPLVPFGGGIDSIVSVELVRPIAEPALFVVSRPGARFEAIEAAAAVTGLRVVRAEREIDPQLTTPGVAAAAGFLNGHVPITAIISAIAVLAAALEGRTAVVMSNEWSASSGTVEVDGRWVNHQHSKSYAFEAAFRAHVSSPLGIDWFSRLRPYTELLIARRFATLTEYHRVFRSCNRAFHIDPAQRLDHWCGRCDKCCFIDLILAPFLPRTTLEAVFAGHEPLADETLRARFDGLLDLGTGARKPFECVGDVVESRVALTLAAARDDRHDQPLVQALAAAVAATGPLPPAEELLAPVGPHFIPERYALDPRLD